jgi:hypothetical protein
MFFGNQKKSGSFLKKMEFFQNFTEKMVSFCEFLLILPLKTKISTQKFVFSFRKSKTRGESGVMVVKITLNLDKKSTEYRGLCFYPKWPRLFWKGSIRMTGCSFNLSSDTSDIDCFDDGETEN